MENKKGKSDLLRRYLYIPLYIATFLIILTVAVFIINRKAGLIVSIFSLSASFALVGIYLSSSKNILKAVLGFADTLDNAMTSFVKNMEIPCFIIGARGDIIWENNSFINKVNSERITDIYDIFSDFDLIRVKAGENNLYYMYKDKRYKLEVKETSLYENEYSSSIKSVFVV